MCILVVEDDFLIRLILVEELVDAGFDVKEAATGDEAIALAEDAGWPLKLVVTDIHMPGALTGIDVAAHVQRRSPEVPVIFTTGRPDALATDQSLRPGQHLIRKPYAPFEVIKKIEDLLGMEKAE